MKFVQIRRPELARLCRTALNAFTRVLAVTAMTAGIAACANSSKASAALLSPPTQTQIGLYAGPGCTGLPQLTSFNNWLGRPATHLTEFFDYSSWTAFLNDVNWDVGCYKTIQSSTNFTFSIGMLPSDNSGTLSQGALGWYDKYFLSAARQLVAGGYGGSTIRIGWEFNGNWMPWSSYKDPGNYILYYRRIVTLMRSVPGANFKFDWCPNFGLQMTPASLEYPGDGYVDYIGMDLYDASYSSRDAKPGPRWALFISEPYGLQWQVNFAAQHHKLLSMPEWGCCGNSTGDDPYFIQQMALWFKLHHYAYADYWDVNQSYPGELSNNQYPNAAQAFITAFGQQAAAPSSSSAASRTTFNAVAN
jgi:hypothetical protein